MNCSTVVFTLMCGAAFLSFVAMYFYAHNLAFDLQKKLKTYNTALTQLQEERASLIVKSENMFSDNASQQTHLNHLTEENKILRGTVTRLEAENQSLMAEYKKLEKLLFEEKI
ncbi:MAG: hypothetical protein JNL70_14230 [Saprospiraceae bacterium]|nr:hypothetical protein [Saprospiraceae bacterium]